MAAPFQRNTSVRDDQILLPLTNVMTVSMQGLLRLPIRIARRAFSEAGRLLGRSRRDLNPPGIVFSGDYECWQDAVDAGGTYESEVIFRKTAEAIVAVKNGTGLYERDSVIFHRHDPLYPWPLLSSLLWCATRHDGILNVVDFGGAIGSTYFQCKPFLGFVNNLSWTVIDQPRQVAFGKANLEDKSLKFAESVDELHHIPDNSILILSGVLQCLPTPKAMLNRLLKKGFRYVVLDRTPMWNARDRLTIQHVPSSIYDAVYPVWFFAKSDLLGIFHADYETLATWLSGDRYALEGELICPEGVLFSRIERAKQRKSERNGF